MAEEWFPEARENDHLPITRMIDNGDWNGALKAAKKKVGKMGKSRDSFFPAILTYIQACHPLVSERGEAFLRLQKLADEKDEEKERITNLDDLDIYDHAAYELSQGGNGSELYEIIGRIRVLAVKAKGGDEKFMQECLKKSLMESNFDPAFTTTMNLQDNFPKNREYLFWQLTTRLMIFQQSDAPSNLRGLSLKLASRHLESYAKATISCTGKTLPIKSLQNASEVRLFHRALTLSGRKEDLIAALLDPKIGVNSAIFKGDWSVVKTLVDELHASDAADASKTTIDVCADLLAKACANEKGEIEQPMYGDWAVWNAYVDALMVATDRGTQAIHLLEQFFEILHKHRFGKPAINKTSMRNARLAHVKLMVMMDPHRKEDSWTFKEIPYGQLSSMLQQLELKDGVPPRVLEKRIPYVVRNVPRRFLPLLEYLHEYGHVAAAYTDVCPYFHLLKSYEREQFLGIAAVVMVDRHGWTCEEKKKQGVFRAPDQENFPPVVSIPDQVTAMINHFKLSYFNSHIVGDIDFKSAEEEQAYKDQFNGDHLMCSNCRLICVDPGSTTVLWKPRRACCENCLTAVVKYGMGAYDHAVNGWAEKAWRPFHMKKTDMHPGDDAAIMVAMALIKLGSYPVDLERSFPTDEGQFDEDHLLKHGYQRLVQAAAILEFAHTKSPANPQILLLLVRLYSVLGAGSLAMRAYTKLNLKQVQGETLGYVLLDRISSLHPHPCDDIMTGDEPVSFDPAAELAKLHQRYRGFKKQITKNYYTALENGKYSSVFELMDVHEKLYPSIASVMSVVELRRLIRMRNPDEAFTKSSHGYDILPRGVMLNKLHDNIDYRCFPNFEGCDAGNDSAFIHTSLRTGPKPSDDRMRVGLLADELMMLTKAPFQSRANMTQLILDLSNNFDAYRRSTTPMSTPGKSDFATDDEFAYCQIVLLLVDMVSRIGTRDRLNEASEDQLSDFGLANLRKGLESFTQWTQLLGDCCKTIPDFPRVLHPLYTRHQLVGMVIAIEKLIAHPSFQRNARTTERFRAYTLNPAKELLAAIQGVARQVRKVADAGGHIDRFIRVVEEVPRPDSEEFSEVVKGEDYTKATLGKALRRVLTPEFTEVFASELVASWNESIVGLQCLV